MYYDENTQTWNRTCPSCKETVKHKTRAKCRFSENKEKNCALCTRKSLGQNNALTDTCPVCTLTIRVPYTDIKAIETHAATHSMSAEQLWSLKQNITTRPTCACGCGQETNWINWQIGYNQFVLGHKNETEEQKSARLQSVRNSYASGKAVAWSKGLTKETDERVAIRAGAIALGRKKAFDEGRIKIWNKGLTKETDERIAKISEKNKSDFKNGIRTQWHTGLTGNIDERIAKKNKDLKERYRNNELIPWHKGKTIEDDPRIAKFWSNRDPKKEWENVRWSDEEITQQLKTNKNIIALEINDYRNHTKPAIKTQCSTCNEQKFMSLYEARQDRCRICNPIGSIFQHAMADWVETLGFNVGRNVVGIIGRKELDIYIPEKKLAIECNGLFWHNELSGKPDDYHQQKTDACITLGIDLMHIFEDEWRDKQDIVKSLIKYRLGVETTRIGARECDIIELANDTRERFFNDNHIDGDVAASMAWGLIDKNNDIVSAMSVRRPFHKSKNDSIEIARFCTKLNHNVPGGLSKLLPAAVAYANNKGCKSLLTYADTRFGTDGHSYELAGFYKTSKTIPRFWWTDGEHRYNRFKFKADKKRGLSESQVADINNVVKIWCCGNTTYAMPI